VYAPDGKFLAVRTDADGLQLVDTATWKSTKLAQADVVALAFSRDGKKLAAILDSNLKIWDLTTRQQLYSFRADVFANGGRLVFSPGGGLLALGASDGTIRLLDAANGHELASLGGHSGQVAALAFAPNGTALVSASQDQSVRIWGITPKQ
jgi:WD40 repeat protein